MSWYRPGGTNEIHEKRQPAQCVYGLTFRRSSSEAVPAAGLQTGWLSYHMDPFLSLPSARPAQRVLKEIYTGREDEEEDVSTYWTCLKATWYGDFGLAHL